ncbi:hypothetical protein NFI96_024322, partial [Prochilodus magdalenae]
MMVMQPSSATSATVHLVQLATCKRRDKTQDGGILTDMVIQKRIDGSVNFYRPWEQYKNGFGNVSGEYWLGLENIVCLIHMPNKYELRLDMEDFEAGSAYAQYTTFSRIGPESKNYRPETIGLCYINGGAGECLIYNNGSDFATFDRELRWLCQQITFCAGGFWCITMVLVPLRLIPMGLYKGGGCGRVLFRSFVGLFGK